MQEAVLHLQRLAHIHRVLAGLGSLAGMAEEATRALRSLVDDAEAKLRMVGGDGRRMEGSSAQCLGPAQLDRPGGPPAGGMAGW